MAIQPADVVVDATVGLGGHTREFSRRLGPEGQLIGLDIDPATLELARDSLSDCPCQVTLCQGNFAQLPELLCNLGCSSVTVLFADLGVSSWQLGNPLRGFSFQQDGPLDMRLDPRLRVTAADLVNRLSERELGDLLYHNAQEFAARKIARHICAERRDSRIITTGRLAQIVLDALGVQESGYRRSKIHPATRTFLALRMVVNDEMSNLESLLATAPEIMAPGGRFGVIAFHSEEDRRIKHDFRRRKKEKVYQIPTSKPIVASAEERASNPRSRSAKFRMAIRLSDESLGTRKPSLASRASH